MYLKTEFNNVKQHRINDVYFNVDMSNVRQILYSMQRCYFQRWVSQRWVTSKKRCEYEHLQKRIKNKPLINRNIISLNFT